MKKTFTFFAAFLLSALAFAQNLDPSSINREAWIENPDIVIKGDELKNFPGGQLSEMLLGRLPGVDQTSTLNQETKVVFVVDGFVWLNIDAINIHNIEEVAYYRGALTSKLGVQNTGSGGVVFITTKTAEFEQPFSADFNTLLGSNSFTNGEDKNRSALQSYHVALAQGSEKFLWRTSAVFNKATRNLNSFDFVNQFQLNADAKYKLTDWLDLRVNASYAPAKGDLLSDKVMADNIVLNQNLNYKQDNWNGMLAARLQPLKGLTNEVKFLKNNITEDFNRESSYRLLYPDGGFVDYYSVNFEGGRVNSATLINDLSYEFYANQDRIRFKVGALYQYNHDEYNNSVITSQVSDGTSSSLSSSEYHIKVNSLVGDFSVNLYDILFINAGVRRDQSKYAVDRKGIYAPFYRANLSLKKVVLKNVDEVNAIDLFGSFGEYLSPVSLSSDYPMSDFNQRVNSFNRFVFNSTKINDKTKIQNYGLKTSFFKNRLEVSGDFYKNDGFTSFIVPIPSYPEFTGTIMFAPLKEKGWRIWSSADILCTTAFKWNTGLNVFKNNYEIGSIPEIDTQTTTSDNFVSKSAVQAGMQQRFSYAGFSLNVNGYAYFKNPVTNARFDENGFNVAIDKTSFVNLNYIYLGYNFKEQIGRSLFKNLNVGIVSKNDLHYKKNINSMPLARTLGIALNATL